MVTEGLAVIDRLKKTRQKHQSLLNSILSKKQNRTKEKVEEKQEEEESEEEGRRSTIAEKMEMKYRRNTRAYLSSTQQSIKTSNLSKREQVLLNARPANNTKKPPMGQMKIKMPKDLKYEYKNLPEFAQTSANIRQTI